MVSARSARVDDPFRPTSGPIGPERRPPGVVLPLPGAAPRRTISPTTSDEDRAMHRILAAIRRLLDASLPVPPSDADYPATEEDASRRRWRLWFRRQQKDGRGGNR
jgi:hypothetical protein